MGTSDQDNESPPPPAEQPREVELTNDSLLNGENGDQQPPELGTRTAEMGRGIGRKRRIARRKIRVELIKEPAMGQPDERGDGPVEEAPDGGAERAARTAAPGKPPDDRGRLRGSRGAGKRRARGHQR